MENQSWGNDSWHFCEYRTHPQTTLLKANLGILFSTFEHNSLIDSKEGSNLLLLIKIICQIRSERWTDRQTSERNKSNLNFLYSWEQKRGNPSTGLSGVWFYVKNSSSVCQKKKKLLGAIIDTFVSENIFEAGKY